MTAHALEELDTDVAVGPPALGRPCLWQVVALNDDFTPMNFVCEVLAEVFALSERAATSCMLRIHHEGRAIVGVYSREIAETKQARAVDLARSEGHPFHLVLERVPSDG